MSHCSVPLHPPFWNRRSKIRVNTTVINKGDMDCKLKVRDPNLLAGRNVRKRMVHRTYMFCGYPCTHCHRWDSGMQRMASSERQAGPAGLDPTFPDPIAVAHGSGKAALILGHPWKGTVRRGESWASHYQSTGSTPLPCSPERS